MHFLVRATIPLEYGNEMVKDPNFSQKIDKVMGDVRPESVFFCVENGQRTIYFVVDVDKGSEWPRIVETLWLGLGADADVIPAMTQDDFADAQAHIQAAVRKY
jgi:hypothetical protein